jgi:hypothetical protein
VSTEDPDLPGPAFLGALVLGGLALVVAAGWLVVRLVPWVGR